MTFLINATLATLLILAGGGLAWFHHGDFAAVSCALAIANGVAALLGSRGE